MFCDLCHTDVDRYSRLRTRTGQFLSVCRVCTSPRPRTACANPFSNLRLEHVHDELGRPVEVTSLQQLRAAEKRYGFRSLVSYSDEAGFDKPPQSKQPTIGETMTAERRWLDPDIGPAMYEEMRRNGEVT
jgi:hypothetical protein